MTNQKWSELGAKDKTQLILAIVLIASSILLLFVSFLITMEIGTGVLAGAAEMLATALGLFGIGMYVKNSLIDLHTEVNKRMDELDKQYQKPFNIQNDSNIEVRNNN